MPTLNKYKKITNKIIRKEKKEKKRKKRKEKEKKKKRKKRIQTTRVAFNSPVLG
jgi:hypothetical protein